MTLENKPAPSPSADVEPSTLTADWNEHEHVSDQAQIEAQKLVNLVGSTELAKNAIDVAGQSPSESPRDDRTPTAPTTVNRNDPFLKALEDFETSIETPVLAGELMGWTTTANLAFEHLGGLLRDDVQREHAALYATIAQEDPELSSRVEKLRKADEQLVFVDFGDIQRSFKQLLDQAESAEQDESEVAVLRADVLKQALAFVIGARTQETAMASWFGEAFNRDSGMGD